MKWTPLYTVGMDTVVLDDVTAYGLVRKHVVRFRALPDLTQFLGSAPKGASHWIGFLEQDDGYGHLWLWWKDPARATTKTDWKRWDERD